MTFKRFTTNIIILFLFSGHNTTSITVCYIFYTLATKPNVLEGVRAKMIQYLVPTLIVADPFLLNQLPYTLSVIKEVLRMYLTISGTRIGEGNITK